MRGIFGVAALAIVVAPSAGGTRSSMWWTVAHARWYLVTHELRLVDRMQADQPEFDIRISRAAAATIVPRGPSRARAWRAFHFDGHAYDVLRRVNVGVRFTLVPSGVGARLELVRDPPPNRFRPTFPMRTTFYYEWFPEGWTQEGIYPFTAFHPSLGYYSSGDPAVVRKHIAAMLYGHIAVATYDWWGPKSNQDRRFPLALTLSRQTRLRWAVYYEAEGYGDPSVEQIHDDLAYLRARYFSSPAYLHIGGRPVVFAYGINHDTCAASQRWHDANEGIGAYLVLSAFASRAPSLSFRACPFQPDSWHAYGGQIYENTLLPWQFGISPGFDKIGKPEPGNTAHPRDLGLWREEIQRMDGSDAPWHMIYTFNENELPRWYD